MDLKHIEKFNFRMGNTFCGIKKIEIVFEEDSIFIRHNGWKDNSIQFTKDECINDLGRISFGNWKEKYINKDKPISENYWSLSLTIDKKKYIFEGLNEYPNDWNLLEEFIKKYTKISLDKE